MSNDLKDFILIPRGLQPCGAVFLDPAFVSVLFEPWSGANSKDIAGGFTYEFVAVSVATQTRVLHKFSKVNSGYKMLRRDNLRHELSGSGARGEETLVGKETTL